MTLTLTADERALLDAAMAGAPSMDGVANRAPLTALELYGRDGPVAEPGMWGAPALEPRGCGRGGLRPGRRHRRDVGHDPRTAVQRRRSPRRTGRQARVRAAPDGRFSIRSLLPGRYRLTLVRRGVEAWSGAVLVRAGSPTDVVIPPGR